MRIFRLSMMVMLLAMTVGVSACSEPAAPTPVEPAEQRFNFSDRHMGTTFRIVLYAYDADNAHAAATAAFERIGELDGKLSDYDVESELSKLTATAGSGEHVPLSDDLYYMLQRSQEFSLTTGGAFDITVGPVVRLWRRARRRGELPDEQRVAEAYEAVGFRHIELDDENRTARLTAEDMHLDLGGIAKGYAVDEALEVLRAFGISRALVDGGGDIALGDPPPDQRGWRIAVVQPISGVEDDAEARYLIADNLAVATSGDVFQALEIDGVRYSHIIDPRAGEPTTTPMAITVIARDGTTADALASSIGVLGVESGFTLAESMNAAAIVTLLDEETGEVKRHQTENLVDYKLVLESQLDGEASTEDR